MAGLRRTFVNRAEIKGRPKIGLALGSGAARGWAHIGVIRELADMGIRADIATGSSVGSIVAAAYASGNLDSFEEWISGLRRVDIIRLLDARMAGGGFLQGKLLMDAIKRRIGDRNIEDLEIPFACVATELGTGREIWLRHGSLLDACRSSIALPGLFAPSRQMDERLLVDGGLVNPVPVSLARAMGADIVIAVNLNGGLVGQQYFLGGARSDEAEPGTEIVPAPRQERDSALTKWAIRMKTGLGVRLDSYISSLRKKETSDPGLFDVIVAAIDIMQDRITRSRMAGEPPDIHLTPRLSHIGLMDFDRAHECIAEGRLAVQRQKAELENLARVLGNSGDAEPNPHS